MFQNKQRAWLRRRIFQIALPVSVDRSASSPIPYIYSYSHHIRMCDRRSVDNDRFRRLLVGVAELRLLLICYFIYILFASGC